MFSRLRFLPRGSDESMCPSDMVVGLVPPMVRYKVFSFSNMGFGCVPPMVRCECWECLSDMVIGCVPLMVRCKCWVGHYDLGSNISVGKDLHGG